MATVPDGTVSVVVAPESATDSKISVQAYEWHLQGVRTSLGRILAPPVRRTRPQPWAGREPVGRECTELLVAGVAAVGDSLLRAFEPILT